MTNLINLDLFVSLVPIALTNALQGFSAKRAEIMTLEVSRLREATNVLNAYVHQNEFHWKISCNFRFLASMNLPAAIEDSGGRQIPPSVTEKANEIKRQGGIQTLEKMFNDLPEALTRNKEILEEVCFVSVLTIIYSFSFPSLLIDNPHVRRRRT